MDMRILQHSVSGRRAIAYETDEADSVHIIPVETDPSSVAASLFKS